MHPKESIRLLHVSRWRSTARIQVGHAAQGINSTHTSQLNGDQQLALTTSAKSRSCSLRNQLGLYKSADEDQQLALTTSAKSRPCRLRNQFSYYKLADTDQQLALTSPPKKQVMQSGNQNSPGKAINGDQ